MNLLLIPETKPPLQGSRQALLPLEEKHLLSNQSLPSGAREKCLILICELLQAVVLNPKEQQEGKAHE